MGNMATHDSWLQKVPPNSVDAEQSILSAVLIDNQVLPEVLEVLSPRLLSGNPREDF